MFKKVIVLVCMGLSPFLYATAQKAVPDGHMLVKRILTNRYINQVKEMAAGTGTEPLEKCICLPCVKGDAQCICLQGLEIQKKIKAGKIQEAYDALYPIVKDMAANRKLYENPSDAVRKRICSGELGVVDKAARMLEEWAESKAVQPFEKIKCSTVMLTFGQSNSANYGKGHYKPVEKVYDYYKGHIYPAADPLIGSGGEGATVWTRLGDKMIESGMAEAVTIVPIGVGGVRIGAWAKGGELHGSLINTVERLKKEGVKLDYILWHQGETDNILNTSKEDYIQMFETIRDVFRSRGVDAPIVIAIASYHPSCVDESFGCSDEIRAAQRALAKKYKDIYEGPDTDLLDKTWQRGDGVHFSALGQNIHADMWLKCLKKIKK